MTQILEAKVSSSQVPELQLRNGLSVFEPITVFRPEHLSLINALSQGLPKDQRVVEISELRTGKVVTIRIDTQRVEVGPEAGHALGEQPSDSTNIDTAVLLILARDSLADVGFNVATLTQDKKMDHLDSNRSTYVAHLVQRSAQPSVSHEIIDRAIHGDKDAFAQVYETMHERVRRYIFSALQSGGVKQAFEFSQDLAQDTFERAWRARDNFVFFRNVPYEAYLFRTARNAMVDMLRRRENSNISLEYAGIDREDKKGFVDNIELIMATQLIKDLPPAQQQVMTLVMLGYNMYDMAYLLGKTPDNLKALTHKGRVRLKDLGRAKSTNTNQMLLIAISDHLVRTRKYHKRPYKDGSQLKRGLEISLSTRLQLTRDEIDKAFLQLPEGFLDNLVTLLNRD